MSAELLRRAAAILRERASGVEPGPWERADNIHGVVVRVGSNWPIGDDDAVTSTDGYAIADWVAMMHPGVGLDLADLLDEVAAHAQSNDEYDGLDPYSVITGYGYALAIARRIVGEQS